MHPIFQTISLYCSFIGISKFYICVSFVFTCLWCIVVKKHVFFSPKNLLLPLVKKMYIGYYTSHIVHANFHGYEEISMYKGINKKKLIITASRGTNIEGWATFVSWIRATKHMSPPPSVPLEGAIYSAPSKLWDTSDPWTKSDLEYNIMHPMSTVILDNIPSTSNVGLIRP